MKHPTITRFRQTAALTSWLIFLVTAIPILLNGIIGGTFVLPVALTRAELAWIAAVMPLISLLCTWILHGLLTGDWAPPALDSILKLFQPGATTNGPDGTPIPTPKTPAPPPAPDSGGSKIALFQDRLASMQPVAPLTNEDPPHPF